MLFKIKRQDDPLDIPYWEEFEVDCDDTTTIAHALALISCNPVTVTGEKTRPVVFECSCKEGACGACAMIINGKAVLSCKAFAVDLDQPITLEPLSKFPMIRDLKVDRSGMFDAIIRAKLWIETDEIHHGGAALRFSKEEQLGLLPLTRCNFCGVCVECCPQVNIRSPFVGAFVFCTAAALNEHPIGKLGTRQRLDALISPGMLPDCAGAQVCDMVCPMDIPLAEAISRLGGLALVHAAKRLLWG